MHPVYLPKSAPLPQFFVFANGQPMRSVRGEDEARQLTEQLATHRPTVTYGYCPAVLWSIEQHRLMVENDQRYGEIRT